VRYADGFNLVSGSREDITTILESINAYCEKYSRKFSDLLASWQGFITIGRTEADVRAIVERAAGERRQTVPEFMRTGEERGYVIGTPESCVERLRGLRDLGFNHFMLIFSDDTSLTPLELFRDEVIPNLK
jgi:alkanesulfonate monooxygenase SsuD/methylene tetrahydromethanopterin reductase-like flavin-dependent oxidoreductase (luciferase family)